MAHGGGPSQDPAPRDGAAAQPEGEGGALDARELGFVRRVALKYQASEPVILLRSVVIVTVLVATLFAVATSSLPRWLSFAIVYGMTMAMYIQYRRFAMFKMRVLKKLAVKAGFASEAPPGR